MAHITEPEFDPRFNAEFQRGFEEPPPVTPPPAGAPPLVSPSPLVIKDPPKRRNASPARVPEAVQRRRNPWLITLWAAGGVLVIAGLAAVADSATVLSTADYVSAVDTFVRPQLLSTFGDWAVGAGLASLVAATAISAVRWRGDD